MTLYAPPSPRMTEIFTVMPNRFRLTDRASDWIDANKPGQQVDSFLGVCRI